MRHKIDRTIRVYNEERNGDEIFYDIYELILEKLDSESLVKET